MYIQLALHIGEFGICEFNQLQIENIGKKYSRKLQKAKIEFVVRGNYLLSIYIVFSIITNLEMI